MHNILAVLIASEFISEDREQQKCTLLLLKCTDNVVNINMNIEEMSVGKVESTLFMFDITHFKSEDKLKISTSLLRLLIKIYCMFVIIHLEERFW